jgi:hypothetical protein
MEGQHQRFYPRLSILAEAASRTLPAISFLALVKTSCAIDAEMRPLRKTNQNAFYLLKLHHLNLMEEQNQQHIKNV